MLKINVLLASTLTYVTLVSNLVIPVYAEEKQSYGPIQSGDNLWSIATKVSPASVSRHQAIMALHRANPHAFSIPCNMNSLKIGKTLHIPSLSEMQVLSHNEAVAEMERQREEWKTRHRTPIVCPPIVVPPPMSEKQTTTEEAKAFPIEPNPTQVEPSKTSIANPISPLMPPTAATNIPSAVNTSSAVTQQNLTNDTQTIALVPEENTNNTSNTPNTLNASTANTSTTNASSLFSPMMIIIGLIIMGGLLLAIIFIWLSRQRAKKKPMEATL